MMGLEERGYGVLAESFGVRDNVEAGGLMSYGTNVSDAVRDKQ